MRDIFRRSFETSRFEELFRDPVGCDNESPVVEVSIHPYRCEIGTLTLEEGEEDLGYLCNFDQTKQEVRERDLDRPAPLLVVRFVFSTCLSASSSVAVSRHSQLFSSQLHLCQARHLSPLSSRFLIPNAESLAFVATLLVIWLLKEAPWSAPSYLSSRTSMKTCLLS